MEKIITETNQWIQYGGCGVFIPEGYNGPLDVIVYGIELKGSLIKITEGNATIVLCFM